MLSSYYASVPGNFLSLSFSFFPLAIVPCNKVLPYCMPHGGPPLFLLVATLVHVT